MPLPKIPCNTAVAALCNRAPFAFHLPHPRISPLRSLRSQRLGEIRPPSLRLAPPCYGVCVRDNTKSKQPSPQPSPTRGEGVQSDPLSFLKRGRGDYLIHSLITLVPFKKIVVPQNQKTPRSKAAEGFLTRTSIKNSPALPALRIRACPL